MNEYLVSLLTAFVGTIGFSIFFNIKKERLLYVAISGTVICAIYLCCLKWLHGNLFLSNLIPSILATIYAELSARLKKAPAIVFLLPAIIVLIPGGSFYYTMSHLVNGNEEQFREVGMQTMQSALGIAVGILVATAFFYQVTKLVRFIMTKLEMQHEKNLK
ncbi:MAG: threonine/serine exporter family protein [Lachnospiraceae bacterium]